MKVLNTLVVLLAGMAFCLEPGAARTRTDSVRPPVIDMHLHAYRLDAGTPLETNPVTGQPSAAGTSARLRDMTLAELARYNIVKAVASGPAETVGEWREAAPDRIMVGAWIDETGPLPDLEGLRAAVQAGRVDILGEFILQMRGMAPGDPRMEPYYALAEEMDVPVGIHTGVGPPGTPDAPCCPNFRVPLGNPALVEEVLIRHPRLRVFLMHGGWPCLQETKAILSVYPQVCRSGHDQLGHPPRGIPQLPAGTRPGRFRQAAALRVGPDGVARGD